MIASPTTTARKASKTDSITVKPYTVPVDWVEITVQIPADLADFLDQRTPFVQSRYGRDVWSVAISVTNHAKLGRSVAEIHRHLKARRQAPLFLESGLMPPKGKRLREFTIQLEKEWSETVAQASEILEVSIPAFIRAALQERAFEIRRFIRAEAARVNGGHA